MIITLDGKIEHKGLGFIILNVAGVGYKVFTNLDSLNKIKEKKDYKIFTHQYIRENNQDLYGFLTFEELELFELLLSVSGIGPKAGQAILSRSHPEQIKSAIIEGDLEMFTAVSGVGRKTATRVILELKTKISADDLSILTSSGDFGDILEALKNLGYQNQEARKILAKMPKNLKNSEEKIKWALQQLASK